MPDNLKIVGGKGKGKKQGILGVQVFLKGSEYQFNYSTILNPEKEDIGLLKDFRNKFVDELEKVNFLLGQLRK